MPLFHRVFSEKIEFRLLAMIGWRHAPQLPHCATAMTSQHSCRLPESGSDLGPGFSNVSEFRLRLVIVLS